MLSEPEIQDLLNRMAAAYSARDAHACARMFTADAQLHSPFAPPAVGLAALTELHLEWTAESSAKSFTILDWGSADRLAWCLARFSEGALTGDGTSLIILERQADGQWLIRSCCLYGDEG